MGMHTQFECTICAADRSVITAQFVVASSKTSSSKPNDVPPTHQRANLRTQASIAYRVCPVLAVLDNAVDCVLVCTQLVANPPTALLWLKLQVLAISVED
jgi:hypothetical protein